MPLNASGALSLGGSTVGQSVNLELGQGATATITMNDTNLRSLFGVASGQISMNAGYGKSSYSYAATKGIYAGGAGAPTGNSQKIESLIFSTVTTVDSASSLAFLQGDGGSTHSTTTGFYAGGNLPPGVAYTAEITGVTFSTATAINPAAVLAQLRLGVSGVHSTTNGYYGGGLTPPGGVFSPVTQIDGITFATQAATNPTAALVQSRGNVGAYHSQTKGYYAGGVTAPTGVTQIDAITFTTELMSDPAAALAQARQRVGGVISSTTGYLGGGQSQPGATVYNQIDGLTFSTETAIDPAATLAQARNRTSAVNSSTTGYWAGGSPTGLTTGVTQIDGITFATNAAVDPAAALVQNRSSAGMFNDSNA